MMARESEVTAVFGFQGFRQPEENPQPHQPTKPRHEGEQAFPTHHREQELAQGWCENGRDHHDHEHKRQGLGHLVAHKQVTHQRNANHGGCRSACPLQEAQGDQAVEVRDEIRREGGHHIDANTAQQRHAAAKAVGQGAEHQLQNAKAQHVGRDDELAAVLVCLAQAFANLLQARQHDVDGKGIDGDERRDQRDEFNAAQMADNFAMT